MLSSHLQNSVRFVFTDGYRIGHRSKIETAEVHKATEIFKNILVSMPCKLTLSLPVSQLQQELQAMKQQQELAEKERRLEQQQQQQQNQQEKEQERHRREQHVSSLILRGKERSRESKSLPPSSPPFFPIRGGFSHRRAPGTRGGGGFGGASA